MEKPLCSDAMPGDTGGHTGPWTPHNSAEEENGYRGNPQELAGGEGGWETEGFWKGLTTRGRPVDVRVRFYNFMAFCRLTCLFSFLFLKDFFYACGIAAHTFNSSPWKTEAGGSLGSQGLPGLQSEFQSSKSYPVRPWLKKKKKKSKGTNFKTGLFYILYV